MKALTLLQRQPVRIYLYTVFAAVVALLVAMGVVTATLAPLILAVGTAVLAVPAVEVARSKVTPVAKVAQVEVTDGLGPDEEVLYGEPESLLFDEREAVDQVEEEHS